MYTAIIHLGIETDYIIKGFTGSEPNGLYVETMFKASSNEDPIQASIIITAHEGFSVYLKSKEHLVAVIVSVYKAQ